eukprot:CAMPEP_0114673238 /NCGR_PEP_ID=MMETSP0191-20121206/44352_1 /TAXON_ID=126664 /ORGANISM="Sorites sp." /LENGTH=83 /DNA_ID=CAMNT_0001937669 /DNA_START=511 /DNA_END=765 /DNA_ORIENTATION=-
MDMELCSDNSNHNNERKSVDIPPVPPPLYKDITNKNDANNDEWGIPPDNASENDDDSDGKPTRKDTDTDTGSENDSNTDSGSD